MRGRLGVAKKKRDWKPTPPSGPYGWDGFTERAAIPENGALVSPASELGSLLQRYRADLSAADRAARDAASAARSVAIEQAVLVAQLDRALTRMAAKMADKELVREHKQLRVIKDQMLAALEAGGITVDDPTGRPFQTVADRVDVVGWRHAAEFTDEVVAETHEAVVLHQGAVVRTGQVVMGAPPKQEEDA
jgi:hypothetical protein